MAATNHVRLEGELARAPEVRDLPSGTTLATLTMRVPGTETRKTSIPVTVWDPGKRILRLTEGTLIDVTGRVLRRFWTGSDGALQSRLEVVADSVVRSK